MHQRADYARFVCATLHSDGRAIRLRSYETEADRQNDISVEVNQEYHGTVIQSPEKALRKTITINEAVRATSAAPTFFPRKEIDGYTFWDGGVLNNNPVDQVWAARNDLVDGDVALLLSLGTGYSDIPKSEHGFVLNTLRTVADYATNTESKHKDFEARWKSIQARGKRQFLYARLNTPTHDKDIKMDKPAQMEDLKNKATAYLRTYAARRTIEQVADILSKPPSQDRIGRLEEGVEFEHLKEIESFSAIPVPADSIESDSSFMDLSLAILGVKQRWWQRYKDPSRTAETEDGIKCRIRLKPEYRTQGPPAEFKSIKFTVISFADRWGSKSLHFDSRIALSARAEESLRSVMPPPRPSTKGHRPGHSQVPAI
jgi:hypothetical protein